MAEYKDEAFSAFRGNRGPGLAEAMLHAEDLASEQGTAELWVQHSDRLARGDGYSARHTVEVALWALKRDVKICTIHDPDTFRDLLYAVVTGQRNHEDSRRKSLSSQAGRRRAAARGDFIGYKPDGYRLGIDIDDRGTIRKRMEIDPDRQLVIATIFRLALAGKRPGPITIRLNREGWVTKPSRRGELPVAWKVGRVMEVLKNPRYAALAVFDGEIVARGHWPAYITERQHLRITATLAKGRPTKDHRQIETYLLARLARCGRCGRGMYALTGLKHADGTFARRYLCSSHRTEHGATRCRSPTLEAGMVEAMFVSSLRVLLLEESHVPTGDPRARARFNATGIRSLGRAALEEAIAVGDEDRVDMALERLLAEMGPQLRDSTKSRRDARQLALAIQCEAWAEQERTGRTESSRTETTELNRLLREMFSQVAITPDETAVRFVASRESNQEGQIATRSEAEIDLREWTRYAALSRRVGPRHHKWTKPEIIGSIQAWADQHQRTPRHCDVSRERGGCPGPATVLRHFGSWEAALHAAGLGTEEPESEATDLAWREGDTIWGLATLRTASPAAKR